MSAPLIEYADSEEEDEEVENATNKDISFCYDDVLQVNCAPKSLYLVRKEKDCSVATSKYLSSNLAVSRSVDVERSSTLEKDGSIVNLYPLDILNAFYKSVEKLKHLHSSGKTINNYIRNSPEYQNPYSLEKIMTLCKVSPYCSNFPRNIYDPYYLERYEAPRFKRLVRLIQTDPASSGSRSSTNPLKSDNQTISKKDIKDNSSVWDCASAIKRRASRWNQEIQGNPIEFTTENSNLCSQKDSLSRSYTERSRRTRWQ